jgi:hypothetical protein
LALVFNFVPIICYGKRNPLIGKGQEKFPKLLIINAKKRAPGIQELICRLEFAR